MDSAIFRYIEDNFDTRSRKYERATNRLISEYRLTAMKSHGFIRQFCNQKANELEKKLNRALVN
jgi:hypothetical protein